MASVKERVIDIVAEQLGVSKDQITPETSFVNDLGADSLDTVELVMELEEEFDINIPDDAAEKIQTVGQAIDYIEKAQSILTRTFMKRRVVVTGLGAVTSLSCQVEDLWQRILRGESGIHAIPPVRHHRTTKSTLAAKSRLVDRAITPPRTPSASTASRSSPWWPAIDAVNDCGHRLQRRRSLSLRRDPGLGHRRADTRSKRSTRGCWKKAPTRSRPSPFPS